MFLTFSQYSADLIKSWFNRARSFWQEKTEDCDAEINSTSEIMHNINFAFLFIRIVFIKYLLI